MSDTVVSDVKKKKAPVFWIIFSVYTVLLAGALCFGISVLWKFLAVYEETRPVHAMEDSLSILTPERTDELQSYLTNEVENPYEDLSAVLSRFYELCKDQELTFGKLSGSYTENHPVYAVLAGDTHVATVSFLADTEPVDYRLCGWKLEAVTLLVQPKYSFALTVPSSMKVLINGLAPDASALLSETPTDTPVSYRNYSVTGLYEEPVLEVFDRYGQPVSLSLDEETGGYYYRLAYATAPSNMTVSFGGRILDETHCFQDSTAIEALSFLEPLANRFPEYQSLPEQLSLPSVNHYYIDFSYSAEEILWTDQNGDVVTPEYDETTNSYSHAPVSCSLVYEDCVPFVFRFVEQYALFCANDAKSSTLTEYFPPDSEYCKLISRMDNRWYNSHSDLTFQNHEVKDFFAYTKELAYVHVTVEQKMRLRATGKYQIYTIDLPIWTVRMDGQWYIAMMEFNTSAE